ncbi:MAG: signal peptide peptidase SppA, partial [Chitinophagales bacterium]
MRSFFTSFFASLLAFLVFCIIIFFVIMGVVSAFSRQFEDKTVSVRPNSVLRINTNYSIAEQTQKGLPSGLGILGYDPDHALGLNDILANIRHAAKDDNIKGIYLELGICPNSYATLQEIRDALEDFKSTSGKFVVAYGEVISQNSYYLGSVADKVYLNPSGAVDFKGLSAQISFYKGTLDKLGVKTEVFYDGKFKSATEPYRFDKMSDENRLQLREFLNALFDENLSEISDTRKMDVMTYRNIADSLKAWYPQYAVQTGLMDGLIYYDEVVDEMKEHCGISADRELNFVSMHDYRGTYANDVKGEDRIALVYADGTIIDGEGSNGYIGSRTFAKMMYDVRQDKNIKAVVLRVNSPGGSAVASDVMWREIEITKKVKPVVVSMGDYAASGGYMISCNADKIFAEPNTLTGSIG